MHTDSFSSCSVARWKKREFFYFSSSLAPKPTLAAGEREVGVCRQPQQITILRWEDLVAQWEFKNIPPPFCLGKLIMTMFVNLLALEE